MDVFRIFKITLKKDFMHPSASEYGDDFHALLINVENKLRSQLEKR